MKGDIIIVEQHHQAVGSEILNTLLSEIKASKTVYCFSVSGESGSGKSELSQAMHDLLETQGIKSIVLGQDDYFKLPPKSNDEKRRSDNQWLGPRAEVNLDTMNQNIMDIKRGASFIKKSLVDYDKSSISEESISTDRVRCIFVEGTYTALIKNVDCRIFIDKTKVNTDAHRKKRNRGNEYNDPFIENILEIEHKIIAGHYFLADIVVTKDNQIIWKK